MQVKHFINFVLLIFSLSALGQSSSIKGTIFSQNETLPFATIQIKENKNGTTSDIDGKYSFNELLPGKYSIIVSFVGYVPKKKEVTLAINQNLTINFNLNASATLDEVVITGTMKATYISTSPIKIDIVTSTQLDTYLPAAASSIVEGIKLVNGVQEVVACGVCYTSNISINGLSGAYTAILMDGTPMYGNLASVYGLNGIPSMIIDRFEVIKGPSSTLYGSEAVAGVINIITKDPEKQPLLSVDLMATTHKEVFGNLAFAPTIGKSNGYIGINYAYVNDFDDINDDGFGDAINLDRISIFSKINFSRKSDKPFSLSAKYYYEDRRNGVEEYLENRAYRELRGDDIIYGESIYTNRVELFGTYIFNSPLNIKLDYSFSNHLQDSYYGSDYYRADQQIAYANLTYNLERQKHDILFGLTMRYNAYDDNTIATESENENGDIINSPDNQFIPGIFVQDEFTASNKFTFLGGMRLDHYTNHGFIFAPRLSLKYKPSEWTTLRTNFGTGFRIVNLFTEDHAFITGQRKVIIAETLEPEKSYNISLNFNQIYNGLGGNGSVDIEAYYTHFTNKIIPDYETPGEIIYENSKGYAETMGIGVTFNHAFEFPLGFNIGFNVQRATETEENDQGKEETKDLLFAPKWSGVFTANYLWRKPNITFAYTANLTGVMALPLVHDLQDDGTPSPISRSTQSEPFSVHSLQITKVYDSNFTIYTGIDNIYDFRQKISPLIGYNDPNANPGFSSYFDTSYAYAPNHGREFYIGVRWNLDR